VRVRLRLRSTRAPGQQPPDPQFPGPVTAGMSDAVGILRVPSAARKDVPVQLGLYSVEFPSGQRCLRLPGDVEALRAAAE
jgi:hypothetical protein